MRILIALVVGMVLFSCAEDKGTKRIEVNQDNQIKDPILPSNVVLGDYAFIEIGCKLSIEDSKAFYEKLDFIEVPNQFEDENMMMMSDSNLVIVLNKSSIAPATLTYLNTDFELLISELTKTGVLMDTIDQIIQLKSPDGEKVVILNMSSEGLYRPGAKTMMEMMQTNEIGDPSKLPNKKMGVFGEFSHQVRNIKASLKWWAKLGIVGQGIMEYGYKFSIIYDKQMVIGIHEKQDEKWLGSAITYFATDQDRRLEELKKVLDPETVNESEKLGPGSAIIKSPEGNLIFVFKL